MVLLLVQVLEVFLVVHIFLKPFNVSVVDAVVSTTLQAATKIDPTAIMSSKFLDSMLTKYQAEAAGAAAVAAGGSSYSSQHARMYPYVSAMGQSGFPGGVAGYSNALANAAESAAAATAAAAQADKQCRYTGSAAAAASMAEAMVNYSLGAAHQNGVAGAAAASMAQAAAANFYQQAASAGGAAAAAAAAAVGVDPNNPLSACSQGGPPAGLGALTGVHSGGGPDIPRYPWMSITGDYFFLFHSSSFIFCFN